MMNLFGMVASQHPLRIGLSQSSAQQFLLLGFFVFRILTRALASSFVYSTHLYFEASLKSSFIS
jgi:hypothetical protein